jgi:acyl-coenzyme A thioesterase PaaI-like protein
VAALAIQDQLRDNFCWGCGADNPDGLQLKSVLEGDVAIAHWHAQPRFAAGPRHVLNGGIIATLLDCHGVCHAIAADYAREGRAIGAAPSLWHATTAITVEYLRPTPIDEEIVLSARVTSFDERRVSVECVLSAAGKDRARARVDTVRVPDEWRHGAAR